jgi:hypothetical protein
VRLVVVVLVIQVALGVVVVVEPPGTQVLAACTAVAVVAMILQVQGTEVQVPTGLFVLSGELDEVFLAP